MKSNKKYKSLEMASSIKRERWMNSVLQYQRMVQLIANQAIPLYINKSLIRDNMIKREINKWVGRNNGPHPLSTLNKQRHILILIQYKVNVKYKYNRVSTSTKEIQIQKRRPKDGYKYLTSIYLGVYTHPPRLVSVL